jgi:hypothetical protein
MTKSQVKLPRIKVKTAVKAGRLSANHNAKLKV